MPNFNADGTQQTRGYRTVRSVAECPKSDRDISLYADGTLYRRMHEGSVCEGSHHEPEPPDQPEPTYDNVRW